LATLFGSLIALAQPVPPVHLHNLRK